MDRRAIIGYVGGMLAVPLVWAQQPERVPRIGFLYFGSEGSASSTGRFPAFVDGMRELGYQEGRNYILAARFGDSQAERIPGLVAELLRLKADVIVATGSPVYVALRQAGAPMPVVITVTADPMLEGFAKSLARPGGNFTGLSDAAAILAPKHLELLTTVVPSLARIGVLVNPDNASHPAQLQRLMASAQRVGVQVVSKRAAHPAEIDTGFSAMAKEGAGAALLLADTFFAQQLQQIAQVALANRLPSIYLLRDYARAGGLMSYGPDLADNFRRAAAYVDKILKGARPGDLPFDQPTRYELAINLATARALGITVPQTLLLRADEVIG